MAVHRINRVYVRKKGDFAIEARQLQRDLAVNYGIEGLTKVSILNRYDVSGLDEVNWQTACWSVFAEKPLDDIYEGEYDFSEEDYVLAVEALPGQYEQREDSAEQALEILTRGRRPKVRTARIYLFRGDLSSSDRVQIEKYLINPVEAREASLKPAVSLVEDAVQPEPIEILSGFRSLAEPDMPSFCKQYRLAMSAADLLLTRSYFRSVNRDPSMTEIRVLDTYWSDHCRHTTFNTALESIDIVGGVAGDQKSQAFSRRLKDSLANYEALREIVHGERVHFKKRTLMDLATIAMKELKRQGLLADLDESEEINACSIRVPLMTDYGKEDYLIMFKNETHNHPTEIEPFGGAATCLGGAIRDPLSGRSYVYQAMRVTGSGDPTQPIEDTLPGKLPQRTITTTAAAGYSSYGNQIGLATGQVAEIYHPGYVAKRMEIGAVIAAVPADQVIRQTPEAGDVVILIGGRTGRDGIGGATGSSKKHDEESLEKSGSEVQKGNPIIERSLQRFFRLPEAARMIRRCNDFGAGGVAVAIGELADGVHINLDRVPTKYSGLDGTELAISESQERMACVIRAEHKDRFAELATAENLEATEVAFITTEKKMVMTWRGETIVELDRSFLDTNGAEQTAAVSVTAVDFTEANHQPNSEASFGDRLAARLSDLRYASQKGLIERFDSTIGANTVLYPLGGRHQLTPEEGMVSRIPLRYGESDLCTLMAYGFDADLSAWSPYHGAYYAVLESIAKLVVMGASPAKIRLTFQEYFPTTSTAEKWGLPLAALLGAADAQLAFKIPSIGGKDSMSGSFEQLDVPPTLVSFAVATRPIEQIHASTLQAAGRDIYLIPVPKDGLGLPIADPYKTALHTLHRLHKSGQVGAGATVKAQGIAATIAQMCFGEGLGFSFSDSLTKDMLFEAGPGGLIVELLPVKTDHTKSELEAVSAKHLGQTTSTPLISLHDCSVRLSDLLSAWQSKLHPVFPTRAEAADPDSQDCQAPVRIKAYTERSDINSKEKTERPRVVIPVFPGTNCDYDSERAWLKAGADVCFVNILNLNADVLRQSLDDLVLALDKSQILMLAGGFSAGDEPEGSAKFIAAVFRNPAVKAATLRLSDERKGLILGICNGFQALIKLGLLPYGTIRDPDVNSPTLTYNTIGRHQSLYVKTKVASVLSPWTANCQPGQIHVVPVSHGEGRIVADEKELAALAASGQIVTQYVDENGNACMNEPYNPNGSLYAIEALCSPDGRILGKMAHSERYSEGLAINIPGDKDQGLFRSAVEYFRK